MQRYNMQNFVRVTVFLVLANALLADDNLEDRKRSGRSLVADLRMLPNLCGPTWASLLHMVPKLDGGCQPCGDNCRLNDATTPDRYPVPHIQDFFALLAGKIRGYHQVPVRTEDLPNTVVITLFGQFEFLHMPFGL
ncbi:hypothetical protein AAFF_G00062010 [Aldrovandia affinis]|uniref:Uncharacterized protein n=1 Tax=Aldrovandia affinis TaxID=143900 RepID=A0AAD7WE58_9TELE|nr:hypothetical protein AAFF_G00062010 [Aldrovandia affinis]